MNMKFLYDEILIHRGLKYTFVIFANTSVAK